MSKKIFNSQNEQVMIEEKKLEVFLTVLLLIGITSFYVLALYFVNREIQFYKKSAFRREVENWLNEHFKKFTPDLKKLINEADDRSKDCELLIKGMQKEIAKLKADLLLKVGSKPTPPLKTSSQKLKAPSLPPAKNAHKSISSGKSQGQARTSKK